MKSKETTTDVAIIGGTGSDFSLDNVEEIKVYTPFGSTSAVITIGDFKGKKVAYIPRHGVDHSIPPHRINFRANIWALKKLGAKFIISPSAVGSLKKSHSKGKFILVDQYIDRTKKRAESFYEGGQICHIGQADPYCEYLNGLFFETGKELNLDIQNRGVYICIEGPRFSTRAESKMFRQWGGDVVGMTNYPEVVLSAEKGICYCCIGMVTDLDVWAGECSKCGIVEFAQKCEKCGGIINSLSVNVPEVLETMVKNAENLRKLLEVTIQKIDIERDCSCHHSLKNALL
ncbi:MAG: MTAP family purine nucleoside phosphorylase [Candidatus Lokiarchaeota archaeon]|nr:MTAP family purine nucleoside phosphorylase [Candidatus Lokiarchaeota archaeon]